MSRAFNVFVSVTRMLLLFFCAVNFHACKEREPSDANKYFQMHQDEVVEGKKLKDIHVLNKLITQDESPARKELYQLLMGLKQGKLPQTRTEIHNHEKKLRAAYFKIIERYMKDPDSALSVEIERFPFDRFIRDALTIERDSTEALHSNTLSFLRSAFVGIKNRRAYFPEYFQIYDFDDDQGKVLKYPFYVTLNKIDDDFDQGIITTVVADQIRAIELLLSPVPGEREDEDGWISSNLFSQRVIGLYQFLKIHRKGKAGSLRFKSNSPMFAAFEKTLKTKFLKDLLDRDEIDLLNNDYEAELNSFLNLVVRELEKAMDDL